MPPENFKMKKFENIEVLSYNIYIKVEESILYGSVAQFWLERRPVTAEVVGSCPIGVAIA